MARWYVAEHRAFAPLAAGIDVLRHPVGLQRYRMVIAPILHVVSAEDAHALDSYVRAGGHLVLGPRSGARKENNALWAPGVFEQLLGARVDFYEVPAGSLTLAGPVGKGTASI